MRYTLTLNVTGDPSALSKTLTPEENSSRRSIWTLEKLKDGVNIHVRASDAVALRATLNSIQQLLLIHEKVQKWN